MASGTTGMEKWGAAGEAGTEPAAENAESTGLRRDPQRANSTNRLAPLTAHARAAAHESIKQAPGVPGREPHILHGVPVSVIISGFLVGNYGI